MHNKLRDMQVITGLKGTGHWDRVGLHPHDYDFVIKHITVAGVLVPKN